MISDLNPRNDPPLDFPERDLGELTAADYDTLGFICGLEVHQQLDTRGKLFCRCAAGRYSTRVDAEILRRMRPTLSELGEYDGTALMEFKTKKEIVYLLERGSVCTYELDDTPPFEIDGEAVQIALEVARLFDLNLVSELHVMRKQYLDGSIPTGFQRTTMVGLAGAIPFRDSELGSDRVLRIRQLSLEEDSCREVTDIGHRIRFRTDRLGMPLTETVTEPDLLTPFDVRRGAELIARVTHSIGRVRRGHGAARQDVNVSIAGSRRVELKGVPSHRALPRLVHIEAFRHLHLLQLRAELAERGVQDADLAIPDEGLPWEVCDRVMDARPIVERSDYAPLRDAVDRGYMIVAVSLPGFGGLLSRRTQPGVTFAREIMDRVRVIACLEARPFLIHSDVQDYGLSGPLWNQLRHALGAGSRWADAIVVLWGPKADVATGVREVSLRARAALIGVPSETRQAFPNGTTGFERILPGADRMYPDTDTPPVPVLDSWIAEIERRTPERVWDREDRYRDAGLSAAAAWRLADAPWADLFDAVAPATGVAARRLAHVLEQQLGSDRPPAGLDAERVAPLVRAVEAGGPLRHALGDLLAALVSLDTDPEALLSRYVPATDAELEEQLARVRDGRKSVKTADPAAVMRWAMGEVLRPLRGRVEPSLVRTRLGEIL